MPDRHPEELALDDLSAAMVRTIREPLLVLDADLVLRAVNPAFYRTFGGQPRDTIGVPLYELAERTWDIPALRTRLEEVLGGGGALESFQVDHVFADVGERIMVLNARRIEREGGEALLLLAVEDMTERVMAQRALERLTDTLARSNEELERFAYVASHDLQEPLRMISSYTQLLARRYEGQLDEKAQKYIGYAVDGAERMQALIAGLLAYSRASRLEGEFEPVPLDRVVTAAVRDLEVVIDEAGATIDVAEDALPTVLGDETRLTQVFRNLFSNALKFRREDPPRIRVTADRSEGEWRIGVHDNGIGISSDYFDQVFLIFKRLNPRREYEGAGLGLALCRKIIEQHDGRISVESELGRGSSFYLTLPTLESPAP